MTRPPQSGKLRLSRNQVRGVDRIAIDEFGIPGIVLMENAGRGAAEKVDHLLSQDPSIGEIMILCGKGNNGGDGFVIARHLQLLGYDVRIVSIAKANDLASDAGTNAIIVQHAGIPVHFVAKDEDITDLISSASVIVDGLLGTGAKPPLKGLIASIISAANQCDAIRVALDIPTGLDCDTGKPSDPTFRANHTLTFVAPKIGFATKSAEPFLGDVHVISIGVPQKLLVQLCRVK